MERENRHIDLYEPEGTELLRYIKGEASDEEKRRVDTWLEADEEHEKIMLRTARIYYANLTMERIDSRDPLVAYKKVESRLGKRVRLSWVRKVSAIAACIVAIIGLSTLISHVKVNTEHGDPQIITLQANAGVRTRFNLPDGTIVYLNSGSVLSYPMFYDQKERRVCLSGEAYFKVAHNEEQPFLVSTSGDQYKVRVLGTEFNIQAYEDENVISTTLVKGSVNLEVRNKYGNISHRKLFPSEKAICYLDKGEISVMKINTLYETAWMDGKLMFKDTPLPEVLKKLSYYYNVEFVIQDTEINSYCLTGILDNRLLSQTLDYLRLSSNIDYRIEEVKTDDSKGTNRSRVILWKGK